MRIVGYIRVSTEEQAQSGLGLEAQQEALRAATARMGVEYGPPIVDDGTSAALALDKRPRLLEAISSLQKGDVLLVAKRDRLSRGDPVAMAFIERFVAKRKARIVSAAGEGTDDDEPQNVLFRRIIDAFAEYERAIIACRTRGALRAKRARGEVAGNIPYGYAAVLANDGRTTKRGAPARRLEQDPREQTALSFMRERHAAGDSLRTIARLLDDRHPARHGRWHPDSVRRILGPSVQTVTATASNDPNTVERNHPGGPSCRGEQP